MKNYYTTNFETVETVCILHFLFITRDLSRGLEKNLFNVEPFQRFIDNFS